MPALPWLGDIIIVITTSSSSCRQIILLGSFFFSLSPTVFALQLHRGGEITFFTKPHCCLYCDSGHTPSRSPFLSYEYPTIGVMVNKENRSRANSLFSVQSHTTLSLWIGEWVWFNDYLSFAFISVVVWWSILIKWIRLEDIQLIFCSISATTRQYVSIYNMKRNSQPFIWWFVFDNAGKASSSQTCALDDQYPFALWPVSSFRSQTRRILWEKAFSDTMREAFKAVIWFFILSI